MTSIYGKPYVDIYPYIILIPLPRGLKNKNFLVVYA
jgi:hypothetical protein